MQVLIVMYQIYDYLIFLIWTTDCNK